MSVIEGDALRDVTLCYVMVPGGNEKNSCDVNACSVTSSSIRKIVTSRAIATAVSMERTNE